MPKRYLHGLMMCKDGCKYHTSNDVFSRCKSVHKMATGKGDDELIQHDNKIENWDTKWEIQKSGKSRIVYGLVTKHDADANDNINDCTMRAPLTTSTDIHMSVARTVSLI